MVAIDVFLKQAEFYSQPLKVRYEMKRGINTVVITKILKTIYEWRDIFNGCKEKRKDNVRQERQAFAKQ